MYIYWYKFKRIFYRICHSQVFLYEKMRVLQWRRPRLTPTQQSRVWKLSLVVVLLLFILVVPIRNLVLGSFLPGMWLPHSTPFLVQFLLDTQSFPVDEVPVGSSPVKVAVDLAQIDSIFLPKADTYPEFHQQIKQLRQNGQDEEELEQMLRFKPNMLPRERAIALFTMDVFLKACTAANLTYFVIAGSLMGAVRHHGMIPWDDDFDVIMNGSEWRKIRDVLSNVEGFELFAPSSVQWKFYLQSLPKTHKPFKWPNMDIFFFNEYEDYIWATTMGAKVSVCDKKTRIFPLKKRRFDMWEVNVPRDPTNLLTLEFGDYHSSCATPNYVHKTDNIGTKTQRYVKCKKLHKYFPFVFSSLTVNSIVERKMVDGRQVSNITIPIPS